jgi:hypothetical protein
MKLSELKGYKSNPLYNILQNSINIKEFIENLRANGYKEYLLGEGYFSGVFARPQDDYVIKIFNKDPGYNKFLKYVLENQNNPHVPKIRGKPIKLLNKYRIVRIEKLSDLNSAEHKEIYDKLYYYIFNKYPYPNKTIENITDIKNYIIENFPNILPILETMKDNKSILDFHEGNIMFRENTPVITDPYADFSVNKNENNGSY